MSSSADIKKKASADAEQAKKAIQKEGETVKADAKATASKTEAAADKYAAEAKSTASKVEAKAKADAIKAEDAAKKEGSKAKEAASKYGGEAKDAAAKTGKKIKDAAVKAGTKIKEDAAKAGESADNFFRSLYGNIVGYTVGLATATKVTIVKYPLLTSNLTTLVAAGATVYALSSQKGAKTVGDVSSKPLYEVVGAIVGTTLAIVDSFAVFYSKNKDSA